MEALAGAGLGWSKMATRTNRSDTKMSGGQVRYCRPDMRSGTKTSRNISGNGDVLDVSSSGGLHFFALSLISLSQEYGEYFDVCTYSTAVTFSTDSKNVCWGFSDDNTKP